MNIKTLLLCSTVAFIGISGAHAAPDIVEKPKSVKYLRACDAYGAGYFYIPGTETCMKLSGYVRASFKGGHDVDAKTNADLDQHKKTYDVSSRLALIFQAASETELGTLRSYARLTSDWANGKSGAGGRLNAAYIELGGFSVGLDDTIFSTWTSYGEVIDDDLIAPAGDVRTNFVSYTFASNTGFAAIIGAELGNASGPAIGPDKKYYYIDKSDQVSIVADNDLLSKQTKDYIPHILLGAQFVQGWGSVSTITVYDSHYKKWANKTRLDFKVNDDVNVWVTGGYKTNVDYYTADEQNVLSRENTTIYANWSGKWAAWTGVTYKITPKAKLNTQISYSAVKTFSASANVVYTLVPGFTITPEVSYIAWKDDRTFKGQQDSAQRNSTPNYTHALNGKNALQAMIRLQRSF
ncbi:porin [Bartonella bacilliformis]|uniref:porin n=1 Tax=Bartonella bacilliformis TaxID=774 RepID=UPI00049F55E0|nr:porin [Bartonella bacilliformis]KEG16543.1 hypothetical protein H705_00412 [Bartonella bacilliformis Cond044]